MNKKVIRITITLVGGEFDDSGSNVLVAEGLRTTVMVKYGGGSIMPTADIVIYGLAMNTMNKLMRIRWKDMKSMMNRVKIEAGEAGNLKYVFEGNITFATIDMMQAPNVGLRIKSVTGVLQAYAPASEISYQGEKSVVQALKEIAESMEYTQTSNGTTQRAKYIFVNDGVPESLTMKDVTLGDTNLNKILKLCRSYQIHPYIEYGKITITPNGAKRNLPIPTITPDNGLIGYPAPSIQGVEFGCLYSPEIRFGGIVRVKGSVIDSTNGDWRVFGVQTHLESEKSNGAWFSYIQATYAEAKNAAIAK